MSAASADTREIGEEVDDDHVDRLQRYTRKIAANDRGNGGAAGDTERAIRENQKQRDNEVLSEEQQDGDLETGRNGNPTTTRNVIPGTTTNIPPSSSVEAQGRRSARTDIDEDGQVSSELPVVSAWQVTIDENNYGSAGGLDMADPTSSNMRIRDGTNSRSDFADMSSLTKDLVYACCSEAHMETIGSSKKMVLPMLKLYGGQPVMINDNIDVSKCIANGAEGIFRGIIFKSGIDYSDLDIITIDGYRIYCAGTHQIEALSIEMKDGLNPGIIQLKPQDFTVRTQIPISFGADVTKHTHRARAAMKVNQFPLNIANCRTVHKLQGRTLDNLVMVDGTSWPYVALSRVRVLKGMFLIKPLNEIKKPGLCRDMRRMLQIFRAEILVEED